MSTSRFFFKGQFGNLDFTSRRSLPNYKNTKEAISFSGGLMYEIADTAGMIKLKVMHVLMLIKLI